MNLLPTMKSASLAKCANCIGEGVVHIVEEHFVPAVLTSQHKSHEVVQDGPSTSRVLRQELVPRQRMREVGNEHPSCREANASKEGHREHEAPTFSQGPAKRQGSKKPNASPQREHEGVVLQAARHPFGPELFVALPARALIWEMAPPLQGEETSSVVQAEEVDDWNPWHRQDVLVPVLSHVTSPLLQGIVKLFWVPAKLSLHQQVDSAGMVPVVLQDELLPRKREEVCEGMCEILLPIVDRKGCAVHDVMVDVNVLDSDVGERDAKEQRAGPPEIWQEGQGSAVAKDHEALGDKDQREHIPHVHHLLRRDLGEQKSQVLRHRVWLVRCWKKPVGLYTSVLVVFLKLQHLVLALSDSSSTGVTVTRKSILEGCNLVIVLVLLLQLLKVFISSIEDGGL